MSQETLINSGPSITDLTRQVPQDQSALKKVPQSTRVSQSMAEFEPTTPTRQVQLDMDLSRLRDMSMEIRIDDGTQTPIVTLKSKTTGEIVMQIPAEYSLTIQQSIEIALGAIVDTKS